MNSITEAPSSATLGRPLIAADAIAQALVAHGVDRLFLMTGGDLFLWRALEDAGIEMCLARSEAGSVVMADAYARLTGRAAVVYGQWGPGAANVAGALADAWWAGSPVVALTSTVPTTSQYRFEYQELEQGPMFAPLTKWQAKISRTDRAADLMTQALRIAEAGPAGPVHLDIPSDLIKTPLGLDVLPPIGQRPRLSSAAATPAAVADIRHYIEQAQRPVLLAGGGVLAAAASGELQILAEKLDVPVVTTMGGKGSIAEDHRLAVGVAGRYSRKIANEVVAEADLVIAVGTDLGGLASDTYTLPRDGTRLIQIDIDPARMGRTRHVDLAVIGDAAATCRQLSTELDCGFEHHAEWTAGVVERRDEWREAFRDIAHKPADGHVRPEAVAWILRETARDDDVIVADTGFMGAWAGTLVDVRTPGRSFVRAAGTLGWAFPAVLGAQLARPESRVFALVGDGGFGYNVGDLETAVRLGIPAVTIVLNNACLAYEWVAYDIAYGGRIVAEVCDFDDVDFGAVARSFGAFGARATSAEEFREALIKAIAHDGPSVIDVVVSKSRVAPVTSFDALIDRDL